ncbi:MAG: ATP-binding cassette domain-containing protein, partial [Clostridiales bacterium]|nr:ATP-binding cassette domain-containing protein [Clostridiales bacterium]
MGKIDIKNTNLFYGDFQALKNINLEIPANKITAFIGPSGCGKSTLLKTLNRKKDIVEVCRNNGERRRDGEE